MTGDQGRAMLSALRLGKERAMARKIWLLLAAIVLWTLGQTAWAQESKLTPEMRAELYASFKNGVFKGAAKAVNANRFLSAEKKALYLRYHDQLFNDTMLVPALFDELIAAYGDEILRASDDNLQAKMVSFIGDRFATYTTAGVSYLSDDDRRHYLRLQNEMMSRLDPHYCVLYANGLLTVDSIAQNSAADVDFIKTLSSEQFRDVLQTQLNVISLGALHKGQPRRVSQTQYDAMTDAFVQELMGWIDSFQPEDLPVVEAYLDGAEISESDYCTLTISLNQMGLEAEGKVGVLVRLMMVLGTFDEAEVVSD